MSSFLGEPRVQRFRAAGRHSSLLESFSGKAARQALSRAARVKPALGDASGGQDRLVWPATHQRLLHEEFEEPWVCVDVTAGVPRALPPRSVHPCGRPHTQDPSLGHVGQLCLVSREQRLLSDPARPLLFFFLIHLEEPTCVHIRLVKQVPYPCIVHIYFLQLGFPVCLQNSLR